MNAIWVALIVAIPTLIATCVVPVILSRMTAEQKRADREADWERQDAVAARVGEVAKKVDEGDELVSAKLEEIHGLVNSNMTAEMQRALIATQGQLVLLKRVIGLTAGGATDEDLVAVGQLEGQIGEMHANLADRLQPKEEAG